MSEVDRAVVLPPAPRRRRSGLLIGGVLVAVVSILIVAGAAGYWVVKIHQRTGLGSVEHAARTAAPGATVSCTPLQSNGSFWACAAVWQARSECLVASVSVLGSVSTSEGHHRCSHISTLTRLLPKHLTAAAVAADAGRLLSSDQVRCAALHKTRTRWACLVSSATGNVCKTVRVDPWAIWKFVDASKVCSHLPALKGA